MLHEYTNHLLITHNNRVLIQPFLCGIDGHHALVPLGLIVPQQLVAEGGPRGSDGVEGVQVDLLAQPPAQEAASTDGQTTESQVLQRQGGRRGEKKSRMIVQ